MIKSIALIVLLDVSGCSSRVGSGETSQSVSAAAIATADAHGLVIALASAEYASRLCAVIGDNPPHDFRWVLVSVGAPQSSEATSDDGYTADVSSGNANILFAQTYPEQCNPAEGNHDLCFFEERLRAGDPGFTGWVSVQKSATRAVVSYDVLWEGTTTRWGAPSYYKHGTEGGYVADVKLASCGP